MSDSKNPFPFWNTDWLEAQRKYMEAWSALSGNRTEQGESAAGNGDAAGNPWNKALEYWWKTVADSAPDETRDFYNKVIDQTQAFYFITDQLSRFMHGLAEVGQSADDWQEALDRHFEEMKGYLGQSQTDMGHMLSGMFGAWQLPMDTMQRTMSSSSVFPGDFLQGFKPDVEKVTDKFLSVPGIGYTRESQEQVQKGLRLLANYQRSAHEYHTELGKVGLNALDIMKQRILEMADKGEEINSLREVYDLWVDCNESAYADFARSEEYSRLYGKLVNDLMALKRHGQGMMDETMSALGMPTRKGMATMQKRQQEMRRELIVSRNRIESLEAELEKVEALEREVKAMRSGGNADTEAQPARKAASSGKKKAGKKTSAKKKTGKKKT